MSLMSAIRNGAVISIASILTVNHVRLREICAEQVAIIGMYRKELMRRTLAHREKINVLYEEIRKLRELNNTIENRINDECIDAMKTLYRKLAAERNVYFDQDVSLDVMEQRLIMADRRNGQRTCIGSMQREKPRRHPKQPRSLRGS